MVLIIGCTTDFTVNITDTQTLKTPFNEAEISSI